MTSIDAATAFTPSIPPLHSCRLDGTPYTRKPDTEASIVRCLTMPLTAIVEQAAIRNSGDPRYVRCEALLFLLRRARTQNDLRTFNTLYPILERRARCYIARLIGERRGRGCDLLRQHTLDRFVELLAADDRPTRALDAFEVQFWVALRSLTMSTICETPVRIRSYSHADLDDPQAIQVPDTNVRTDEVRDLERAIARLPDRKRRVVEAFRKGYLIQEPNGARPDSISVQLGMTRRSVEWQWRGAVKMLRQRLVPSPCNDLARLRCPT